MSWGKFIATAGLFGAYDQCIRKNLLAIAAGADFIIDNDHVHSIIIKATHTAIRISHCLPEDIVRICN